MKDTFGQSVSITLAGESHGAGIVAILSGIAPGISVDEDFIAGQLAKRRPFGAISTSRKEEDKFEILSKNNLLQSQPASVTSLPLFAGSLPLEK